MYTFIQIAAQVAGQAINSDGAIKADWVLVGITGLLGVVVTLLLAILKAFLQQILKDIRTAITKMQTQIEAHQQHLSELDYHMFTMQRDLSNYKKEREEQSREIREIGKTTAEILLKLRAAMPSPPK